MPHSALTPVFTGLRVALHTLMAGLTIFVIVRGCLAMAARPSPTAIAEIALGVAILAVYLVGARLMVSGTVSRYGWIILLCALCIAAMAVTEDAAYLAFPLFFVVLHLVPQPYGSVAVIAITICAILTLGFHLGWSIGVVAGPVIGAAAAGAIAAGYGALFREAREREALIADLVATRDQLARAEHEAGVLAERERLAREIHDTVAQGLSSILLLLHAVERADEHHPAIEHVRLARETAARNLAETRRIIAALAPAALGEHGLEDALRRLAAATQRAGELTVTVAVSGDPVATPMPIETALVRIAQASLANVAQHAQASRVALTLSYMDDSVSLDVVDDGRGFDVAALPASSSSFGLRGVRSRVRELGGSVSIESSPGSGTAVAVSLPLQTAKAAG